MLKRNKWLPGLFLLMIGVLLTGMLLVGCSSDRGTKGKIQDLEFTVLEESEIPAPLAEVIEKNKKTEMKLSYQKDGKLYLVRGFGEQPTGGYSIAVPEVYLAEDGVHSKFQLIGPSHDEKIQETPTCPYIVIQMEDSGVSIHFD
ncbi:MAG: protease complex subunit PrcB family protein [Muricoprocola sp.]